MDEMQKVIKSAIERNRAKMVEVAAAILENPEVGHEEFKAADLQCNYLTRQGFEVARKMGGLETSFIAKSGGGSPVIAVFSEFDALPGIGHACGHHLITLSALAAATAVKSALENGKIPGTIMLVGSPAEEALGGKIDLIRAGALDSVDYSLITHPFQATNTDPGNLAVTRYDVIFHGRAAHASVAPTEGINALDAQILFFNGIALWRQQLPETARVHGTITHGGDMPNIIPDRTSSFFYVRSRDNATQQKMVERFEAMAKGAAMMTGCTLELNKYPNSYAANRPNPEMEKLVRQCAEEAGFSLGRIDQYISTDFADVTLLHPGVNLMFDVVGDGSTAPLHSERFLEYAGKPFAFEQALKAGEALALAAMKLFASGELRNKITFGADGNS